MLSENIADYDDRLDVGLERFVFLPCFYMLKKMFFYCFFIIFK